MSSLTIGIDIGGTRTKTGLVNLESGEVFNLLIRDTEKNSETRFLSQLHEVIQQHKLFASASGQAIEGIGFGVTGFVNAAGVVDSTYGFIAFMEDYPLVDLVKENFHLPCRADNDARTVALGEALYGQGKKYERVLVLTLGTGLGLGFVKDKQFADNLPYAHMGGHITVTNNNYTCYCGKTGCLESLVSSSGIEHEANQLLWNVKYPAIPPTASEIFDAANHGNKDAQQIVEIFLGHLRTGIHNYVNLFAPDVIIIGGGIAKGISRYEAFLKEVDFLKPYTQYTVDIIISELQEHAGILGAAALLKL